MASSHRRPLSSHKHEYIDEEDSEENDDDDILEQNHDVQQQPTRRVGQAKTGDNTHPRARTQQNTLPQHTQQHRELPSAGIRQRLPTNNNNDQATTTTTATHRATMPGRTESAATPRQPTHGAQEQGDSSGTSGFLMIIILLVVCAVVYFAYLQFIAIGGRRTMMSSMLLESCPPANSIATLEGLLLSDKTKDNAVENRVISLVRAHSYTVRPFVLYLGELYSGAGNIIATWIAKAFERTPIVLDGSLEPSEFRAALIKQVMNQGSTAELLETGEASSGSTKALPCITQVIIVKTAGNFRDENRDFLEGALDDSMPQLSFDQVQISTRRWVVLIVDPIVDQDLSNMLQNQPSTSKEVKLKLRSGLVSKWTGRFVQRFVDLLSLAA